MPLQATVQYEYDSTRPRVQYSYEYNRHTDCCAVLWYPYINNSCPGNIDGLKGNCDSVHPGAALI